MPPLESVAVHTKSRSWASAQRKTGALVKRRLPTDRPPTHPGELLLEEFLKPMEITQSAFAIRLGVSAPRMNEIVRAKRGVTADTALRLARVLGTSADLWMGLQVDWDLWHAIRSPKAKEIARLTPLRRRGFRSEVFRGLNALAAEGDGFDEAGTL